MEVTIHYNGQAVAVEVTLEVYEFLDRADHKAENLSHEQRRHWDDREFDEYIVATEGVGIYGETPEEYLCRMETLGELMAILDTCTEAQRRRFLLYALAVSYTHLPAVHLRPVWEIPHRLPVPYTAPYQGRSCSDPDCRYAPGYRRVFQE